MLPLETKRSGGKLLPHSDLRGGVFLEEVLRNRQRKRDTDLGTWEDNIKMDLQEVGGSCGDWMELAQVRKRWQALVSTVRNLRVPKCGEFLDYLQIQLASQEGLCPMQ